VPDDLKEPAGACCELSVAATIYFHRGETAAARRYLTAAAPHAARVGSLLIGSYAVARSLEREVDGALPAALDALTAGCGDSTEEHQDVEDLLADAVRLATATGDLATARAFADRAAALASRSQIPHRRANALYCRGLLGHDAPRLLAAAEAYQEASRPLLTGKALEAAAQEFVAIGDRSQARAAFTQAVEVYMSLGAGADAARLRAAFRAHGIRRGPRGNRPQARKGWDSLTPAEMKVAALVEDGLSNPEIADRLLLSRKTVGNHVSHILKKLDVHSRTDIARESALRTVSLR
jgi:DNA-binding CsgD family transcriptional regulator